MSSKRKSSITGEKHYLGSLKQTEKRFQMINVLNILTIHQLHSFRAKTPDSNTEDNEDNEVDEQLVVLDPCELTTCLFGCQ